MANDNQKKDREMVERYSPKIFTATNSIVTETGRIEKGHEEIRFKAGTFKGKQKIRVSADGVVITIDPDRVYAAIARWARRYVRNRRKELCKKFGEELSEGVLRMLDNAGQLLAASRHLQYLAGREDVEPRAIALFYVQSKSLLDSARQHELSAVALAKAEAEASVTRKTPHELIQEGLGGGGAKDITPLAKRGRGRPRKIPINTANPDISMTLPLKDELDS